MGIKHLIIIEQVIKDSDTPVPPSIFVGQPYNIDYSSIKEAINYLYNRGDIKTTKRKFPKFSWVKK